MRAATDTDKGYLAQHDRGGGKNDKTGIIEKRDSEGSLASVIDASWRDRVTPGHLDMGSCRDCILGQLYGDFHSAPSWRRGLAFTTGSIGAANLGWLWILHERGR